MKSPKKTKKGKAQAEILHLFINFMNKYGDDETVKLIEILKISRDIKQIRML